MKESSQSIVADMNAIVGPDAGIPDAADGTGQGSRSGMIRLPAAHAAERVEDDKLPTDDDELGDEAAEEAADEDDPAADADENAHPGWARRAEQLADGDMPLGALPPGVSNRVVFAEELGPLREGLRRYQFRVASSPVELAGDATWQQFLASFKRTYYVSATLRVAGGGSSSSGGWDCRPHRYARTWHAVRAR